MPEMEQAPRAKRPYVRTKPLLTPEQRAEKNAAHKATRKVRTKRHEWAEHLAAKDDLGAVATKAYSDPALGGMMGFRPHYIEWATQLTRLGASHADIARFLKVPDSTLRSWRDRYPELEAACTQAKSEADELAGLVRPKIKQAYTPNEKDRRQVEMMAGYGIPRQAIARTMQIGQTVLEGHYLDELENGATNANTRVAHSLFEKAMGEGSQAVTACIFWMKTRGGWRESAQSVELTGKDGDTIKIEEATARELISSRIARLTARSGASGDPSGDTGQAD